MVWNWWPRCTTMYCKPRVSSLLWLGCELNDTQRKAVFEIAEDLLEHQFFIRTVSPSPALSTHPISRDHFDFEITLKNKHSPMTAQPLISAPLVYRCVWVQRPVTRCMWWRYRTELGNAASQCPLPHFTLCVNLWSVSVGLSSSHLSSSTFALGRAPSSFLGSIWHVSNWDRRKLCYCRENGKKININQKLFVCQFWDSAFYLALSSIQMIPGIFVLS